MYDRTPIAVIALSVAALAGAAIAPSAAARQESDREQLLRLHETLLEAHRLGDVDRWMAVEADTIVSANGGRITFPAAAERKAGREEYLASATFERYRDVRDPVVAISGDGTMGWVIAEVEVVGTQTTDDGDVEEFAMVWAWVELYLKLDGRWKMTGVVSNSRPLP